MSLTLYNFLKMIFTGYLLHNVRIFDRIFLKFFLVFFHWFRISICTLWFITQYGTVLTA